MVYTKTQGVRLELGDFYLHSFKVASVSAAGDYVTTAVDVINRPISCVAEDALFTPQMVINSNDGTLDSSPGDIWFDGVTVSGAGATSDLWVSFLAKQ